MDEKLNDIKKEIQLNQSKIEGIERKLAYLKLAGAGDKNRKGDKYHHQSSLR